MPPFTESVIEETALNWFKNLGYAIVYGGDIAPKISLLSLRDRLSGLKLMRGEFRVKDVEAKVMV